MKQLFHLGALKNFVKVYVYLLGLANFNLFYDQQTSSCCYNITL